MEKFIGKKDFHFSILLLNVYNKKQEDQAPNFIKFLVDVAPNVFSMFVRKQRHLTSALSLDLVDGLWIQGGDCGD